MITECPKCYGCGTVPHRHVENGRCFLCDGKGQVDPETASRWLARQLRQTRSVSSAPSAPMAPQKRVTLRDFGTALIVKCDSGYTVTLEDKGYLRAGFDVTSGQVVIPPDEVCNGLIGQERALRSALQAALRGA